MRNINRIVFYLIDNRLSFNQEDIRELAPSIIHSVLTKIEAGGTPEKIAENDFLMKCKSLILLLLFTLLRMSFSGAMRVIFTARTTLAPNYEPLLRRLINILGAIAKNPSNPNFDQYIFESISALIRYAITLDNLDHFSAPNLDNKIHRKRFSTKPNNVRAGTIRPIHGYPAARH